MKPTSTTGSWRSRAGSSVAEQIEIDESRAGSRVRGRCDPRFEAVADAFLQNFEARDEAGASVCLNVEGRTVVDLWGGFVDKERTRPWEEDSLSIVFSCTKAATALCAHILIDRGELALHAPVTDYWPEFGQAGKQNVSVAMMLNHTAGVPALRDPVETGGYYDWDYMIRRLEAEEPFWEPGTRNGYHMITFGWTVGELVRRVSGRSLGTFFEEEVAGPLGIDFFIGLPKGEFGRVAPMIPWRAEAGAPLTPFTDALLRDPQSIQFLALMNSGQYNQDAPEAWAAEIGGAGGISNARGLAGLFEPLANGGSAKGQQLLSADQIAAMSAVSVATECDATLLAPTRFGLGFMRSMDNRHRPTGDQETVVMGRDAFGHAGAGGSLGFADPECALAFGYTMTRMGAGILLNERGQSLVDASYCCLDYRTDAPGFWIR
jgi:CubicO group peptidase (beta-lactamase class C family)